MTPRVRTWTLADAEAAAAARAAHFAAEDLAVARLRYHLRPWTVPAGPDPRRARPVLRAPARRRAPRSA